MRIRGIAKKLKKRLFGTGIKPYVPSFELRDLVSMLTAYLESTSLPKLSDISRDSAPLVTARDAVTHFCHRKSPHFFADAKALAALASAMSFRHPEWRERAHAKAKADCIDGLQI